LGKLKADNGQSDLDFVAGLRIRADQLTGAAQFMKLYPDKDLTRFIARGGHPLSMYQDRDRDEDREREAADRASGVKSPPLPPRTLGEILSDAVVLSRQMQGSARLKEESTITYKVWLDHVVQLVGRRAAQSEKVTTSAVSIAKVASQLLQRRDGEAWIADLAKGLIALYYLYFSAQEDALVYKSDYSSNMFTRFVSIRLRDYAAFYASLYTIPALLSIRLREETVKTLLLTLGDSSAPATTIADLTNSLHGALGGERIRTASLFLGLIDSAIAAYKTAFHIDHLIVLDDKTRPLFERFSESAPFFAPMTLNPTYAEVKIGPVWDRKFMTDPELAVVRSSAMNTLRTALIEANALAADLPPLESGSNLFDGGPKPNFEFPSVDQARFLCVGDSGPFAVGISAVEVDTQGRLNDSLLPHMGKIFNYTNYSNARKSPYASRLLAAPSDPAVGLPEDMCELPVPINYLEGEKTVPIRLSVRDLPTSSGDYLRSLEGILCAFAPEEFPYVISQLAAAFIALVKGKVAERVRCPGVKIDDTWTALIIPERVGGDSGINAHYHASYARQFTYGVDTAAIIKANLSLIDKIYGTVILHPDATVDVALLPLAVIPAAKVGLYDYTYVLAAAHKLVPVSVLIKGESEEVNFEPAFFSSSKAKRHGQNWVCVRTITEQTPLITVQQPGVIIGYRPNLVGYLSEEALVAPPSPWKVKPVPVTQILPDPVATAEIVATEKAPTAPEEKL